MTMPNLEAILFDLDGTLLDYDLRTDFLPNYFSAMGRYFANDIHPDKLIKGIMLASEAIGKNDGILTNEEVFAQVFYPFVERTRELLEPKFTQFYMEVFPSLQKFAKTLIAYLIVILQHAMYLKSLRLILVSTPSFFID